MENIPNISSGQSPRDRLIAAHRNIPTPIAFLNNDFDILSVNTAFTTAFGRSAEDLVGQNYLALFPDLETETAFRRVAEYGRSEGCHDRPLMFTDQPERGVTYWDWTLAPATSAAGQIDGYIFNIVETTQRVRAANVLKLASEDLEDAVKQRAAALQRVNLEMAAEVQRRTIAEAELRSLSRRLVQLQEDERRRISQELHDEVGQNLTMLKMILDTGLRHPGAMSREAVKSAAEQVSRVIAQVRNISMALHPSMLEVLGLEPALRALFDRLHAQTGLTVDFNSDIDNNRLDHETRLCAYRVIQEALTNVLRYSGVKSASVTLLDTGDKIALSITDDGRGFDYSALSTGQSNGISGMRERVFTVGGTFRLETGVGKGTSIDIELPYLAAQEYP